MFPRWLTLGVWALAAATAGFWGLRLFAQPLPVPPQATVAMSGVAAGGDLTRLFGVPPPPPPPPPDTTAAPPPPPDSARFRLIGVAAPPANGPRGGGVALIALDGKPARAYRVGSLIDGRYVLQDVQARSVAIGPRGEAATIALELPALPPPATGVPGAAGPAPGLPPVPLPAAPVVLQPPTPAGLPTGAVAPSLVVQPPPALPGQTDTTPQARLRALRTPGLSGGMVLPSVPQMVLPQAPPPMQGADDASDPDVGGVGRSRR
ncbi:MAG: type II secretion system protein N [Rubrivivax sp.]